MRDPVARPTRTETGETDRDLARPPRAFAPTTVAVSDEDPFAAETDAMALAEPPRTRNFWSRLAWSTGGLLVSLGLALAAERLIRDLFARYEWLGWAGIALLAAFLVAIVALIAREIISVRRLKTLDRLRKRAATVLVENDADTGRKVLHELVGIYSERADLASARTRLAGDENHIFDGSEFIRASERALLLPLDARAKTLTAASARRVALVTTVSPRALVDVAFVAYESIRLAGAIARLYGAKPGFFGYWRLAGAVLGHLAVTGGLAMTDGLVEQLVGQGLTAKLSQRLGEGVVNGLMTVRVGIAAMRVTRPLPFDVQRSPVVRDFLGELANLTGKTDGER